MELDKPPLEGKVVERKGLRVGELIEKLKEFDPDLPVLTQDCCYGTSHLVEVYLYKLTNYDEWQAKEMQVEPGSNVVMIDG